MVDIGCKEAVERGAKAQGSIKVNRDVLDKLASSGSVKKGNIMGTARVAGILAAKMTSSLIPLCHNIPLNSVRIDMSIDEKDSFIRVEASATTNYSTGVEMECLTAVSVALLTIYDMCKSIDKKMLISDIKLVSKIKRSNKAFPLSSTLST